MSRGPKTIVGIDPGLYGAFAVIRRHGGKPPSLVRVVDSPTIDNGRGLDPVGMSELVFEYADEDTAFYVEKQQPFHIDSRQACFTTGQRYGYWLAALMIARAKYTLVQPRTWQSKFGIWNSFAKTTKQASLTLARSYFPGVDFEQKDGRSDAALIAVFGCLQWQKEE